MNCLSLKSYFGRKVRTIATLGVAGATLALVTGCGGGGGGATGGAPLSGENIQFAAVVSDLKGAVAGSVGPYEVLRVIQNKAPFVQSRTYSASPQYIKFLNLYLSVIVTTNTVTMKYSKTADGGNSAGQVVITTTDNTTYHAVGHIAGALALTVDVSVTVTGTGGANKMNGSVSLDNQGITMTLKNVAADSSGNIVSTGEMDVDTKGITQTVFTNLAGKASGDITGNVVVTFLGQTLSGTGTLNLVKGTVSLNVKAVGAPTPLTASLESTLNSTVSFTDGKSIDVTDLLSFDLSKLSGATGGLPTGSTNTGYNAPIAISMPESTSAAYVWQALPNGQMVGQATMTGLTTTKAVYWDSPTAAAQPLPVPGGTTNSNAYGITNTGSKRMIVGSYTLDDGYVHACMWTSNSTSGSTNFDAPTTFPIDSSLYATGGTARAISRDGKIVVGSTLKGTIKVPVVFGSGRVFELPLGPLAGTPYEANGVTNAGTVLGVQNLQYNPVIWLNVKIVGSSLTASRQDLLSTNGSSIPATEAFHMGPDGTVVGAQADGTALYWDKEGHVANALSTTGGQTAVAYAVNDTATKFAGLINPTNTSIDLAYWSTPSGAAADISKVLPSSTYSQIGAYFLLADGSFIAIGKNQGASAVTFLYIKKK